MDKRECPGCFLYNDLGNKNQKRMPNSEPPKCRPCPMLSYLYLARTGSMSSTTHSRANKSVRAGGIWQDSTWIIITADTASDAPKETTDTTHLSCALRKNTRRRKFTNFLSRQSTSFLTGCLLFHTLGRRANMSRSKKHGCIGGCHVKIGKYAVT